ncbi:MAG: nitroreductase family protein [Gammaproteobacteria bacterium]|nr:nitroreductase family protein [Gammaproteobacteria bacterium]
MHDDPGLFATMYSMRAMRRLRPDAVPLALVERIIEAGTQAPSGANTQPWAFVVVTEPAAKRFFGERYEYWLKERFGAAFASMDWSSPAGRTARAAIDLAEHMHEAPVLVMVCGQRDWPFAVPAEARVGLAPPSYGSVYPCVQNMLLAARALGLGASLTTMHQMFEAELHDHFGIPHTHGVVAVIPLGWPAGRFGPVRREPAVSKTHYERWGGSRP